MEAMWRPFGGKSSLSKDEAHSLYMFSVVSSCLVVLMRKKEITPLQNYFLVNFEKEHHLENSELVDIAYFLTEMMSGLQKNTNYMDFLFTASQANVLPKNLKEDMIVNIMTMVMLGNEEEEDYCAALSYVAYISEDIGYGTSQSFENFQRRAWKNSQKIRASHNLTGYEETLEIMQDALSRSNIMPSEQ